MRRVRPFCQSLLLIALLGVAAEVLAQKAGGILRRANDENPPSASLHEEGSNIVSTPFVSFTCAGVPP